ncbi:M9 family metallopeptidase [Chitinivorax sp. B]|uniref:M9 family metallopeptidase n=1 Tax=Chitinivorax sp. B TaxID=2502235 RepID=UPI0010F5D68C|nr:M9 family metallopeptidase [Chitinivorax sp. B]
MIDSLFRPVMTTLAVSMALSGLSFAGDMQPPRAATTIEQNTHSVVGTTTVPMPRLDFAREAKPDHQHTSKPVAANMKRAMAADETTCRPEDFAGVQGAALVRMIKAASTSCINGLFSLTGNTARAVFNENQMVSAAGELQRLANSYKGNNDNQILQVAMFLRAGYYVQWYNKKDVGEYGPSLRSAIQPGLESFFRNSAARNVTRENGAVLSEMVTLIDSAAENARLLPSLIDLLNRFDASYTKQWEMRNAVNNVFTVFFRGHQNDDFSQLVKRDGKYVDTLFNFYRRHLNLRGTDSAFLLANAMREMGRFMKYDERKAQVQPLLRTVLGDNDMVGAGAEIWLAAAASVDYYDKDNCNYYGTCNFKDNLQRKALPLTHACSSTVTIRAQQMTADQFTEACKVIGAEEKLFHYGLMGNSDASRSAPVPNDQNKRLEVVVFDDYDNYAKYASAIFGIDTNNGGMYLEGNPAKAGNQARFIAHEAQWMKPKFHIWNLEHEYIHYLDGRFNMEGDFSKSTSQKTVWWIEGVAEYFSHQNDYDEAIEIGRQQTYTLSTILANNYQMSDYTTRAYRWGYLAVRFMFERHRDDVEKVLGYLRAGDYTGYAGHIAKIGTRYDAEFRQWITTARTDGEFAGGKPAKPGQNTAPAISQIADQQTSGGKPLNLGFTVSDKESAADKLRVTFSTSNPAVVPQQALRLTGSGSQRTLQITPLAVKQGEAIITLTVSDGELSSSSQFRISVGGKPTGNTMPTISSIGNQTIAANKTSTPISFTIGDKETDAGRLKVTVLSNDTSLLPTSGLALTGSHSQRALTITPAAGRTGSGMVILSVSDGELTNTITFPVTVADTGGPTTGRCPARVDELSNGCTRSPLNNNQAQYFFINVPAGTPALRLSTVGGSGDVDLYVQNSSGWPNEFNHLAKSAKTGNSENLVIQKPAPGYYHIMLKARQAYSNVALSAAFDAGNTDGGGNGTGDEFSEAKCPKRDDALADRCLRPNQTGSMEYYWMLLPAGSKSVTVSTTGGEGDVVLYAHSSAWPTDSNHLARSARIGNEESVTLENPGSMERYMYFLVKGKPAFRGLSLKAKITKE